MNERKASKNSIEEEADVQVYNRSKWKRTYLEKREKNEVEQNRDEGKERK